jgi:RimJ/RimL family protein N-acetyltransferase
LLRPREPVPVEGEGELGYRLMRRFWRQGLASEGGRELVRHAFEDVGCSRVFAEAMAVNAASRAVMVSIGLRYVGSFHPERDPSRFGAEFGDVEYAVSQEAWSARRDA